MLNLNDRIYRRLFVVGCSRSGTTLLQGMLAGHERAHTFPETGVVLRARGMRGTLPWAYLGLSLGKEPKALRPLSAQIGEQKLKRLLPAPRWHLETGLGEALGVLDSCALAAGKDVWIEKTPRHHLHAGWIARKIPDVYVVHLIRDGREVVASIADRARHYPEHFARQADPRYGIRAWNRAMSSVSHCAGRPRHVVLAYEDLMSEPRRIMRELCGHIGLSCGEDVFEPDNKAAHVSKHEPWKAQACGTVAMQPKKFDRLFTRDEQVWIQEKLTMPVYWRMRRQWCRSAVDDS